MTEPAPSAPFPAPPVHSAQPEQSDYDEHYYLTALGLPYDESQPHWAKFFGSIAEQIVKLLGPSTVLDAGCATGFLVAALAERGVDASGTDISQYAIDSAVSGAQGRVRVHDLTRPLEGRWDLITCIEVLEHMAPHDTQTAIDNVCAATDQVLLSSTPHDFAEPSHVNVQPVATWVQWFAARGFFRRTDLDLSFLSPWAVVLERRHLAGPEVAYLYETELAPLREEAAVKRAELLEAERRVRDLSVQLDRFLHPERHEDAEEEPRYDIDRVLALIDEVIGLRSEISEQRHRHDLALRAARDEAEAHRLEGDAIVADAERRLADMLASRSWRIGQAMLKPTTLLRRLRPRS